MESIRTFANDTYGVCQTFPVSLVVALFGFSLTLLIPEAPTWRCVLVTKSGHPVLDLKLRMPPRTVKSAFASTFPRSPRWANKCCLQAVQQMIRRKIWFGSKGGSALGTLRKWNLYSLSRQRLHSLNRSYLIPHQSQNGFRRSYWLAHCVFWRQGDAYAFLAVRHAVTRTLKSDKYTCAI